MSRMCTLPSDSYRQPTVFAAKVGYGGSMLVIFISYLLVKNVFGTPKSRQPAVVNIVKNAPILRTNP